MVSPEEITKNIKPTSPVKDEKDLANQIAANLKNKVGPLVLKSMMALAPLYLQGDLMQQIEKATQNPSEIAQAAEGLNEAGALAGLSSLGRQDATQQALSTHHQEQGLPKADADKKAQTDVANVAPPVKKPVSEEAPSAEEAGEEVAQEAQAAAAGAEGLGMGPEPQTVAPHAQRAASQRLKQQKAGLPEKEPSFAKATEGEEEEQPTPEIMPPPPPVAPSSAAPKKAVSTPEEEEPSTVPEDKQRDAARQLKEQQEGEGEEGGGGLGDKAKQKIAGKVGGEVGKQAGGLGGEAIGALVGPEGAAAGKAIGQKIGAQVGKQAGEAATGSKEAKEKAEEAIQKALQPAMQQVIDIGWDIYGCGWLITWPLLLYLFYLDWTKQGITLPIIGKIKVVKLTIMQKVDAAFQITLAFLCYGAIIAIFIVIYHIYSGTIQYISELVSEFLRWLGLA